MALLQRRVLFGGIVGIIVIILIFAVFLYVPKVRHASKIQSEIQGLKKQIKENEVMARDIGKLRAQIISLEESQKEFMSKVVSRSELLEVVHQLVKIGEPYKLIFSAIQPPGLDTILQTDNPDSPLKPIPFVFTVQGKYLDIAQYIESLKDFPYFLRTPEIEIIGKEEIRPMIEVRLLMNIYASSLIMSKL